MRSFGSTGSSADSNSCFVRRAQAVRVGVTRELRLFYGPSLMALPDALTINLSNKTSTAPVRMTQSRTADASERRPSSSKSS
jgi:hypothetical protein